jgi:hypothetical protein
MNRQAISPTQQLSSLAPSSGVLQRKCGCGRRTHGAGECGSCRKKQSADLQRAATRAATVGAVPPLVHEVLRTPGQPLEASSRAFFEPRFGQDFSGVRVHTDARAAESARAVNALAYTAGNHVVFDAGQYAPGTPTGRQLLAHELAHVVQQAPVQGVPRRVSQPGDPLEQAAEAVAADVLSGPTGLVVPAGRPSTSPVVSRKLAQRMMKCAANTNGAPADPFTELTDRDSRAAKMTSQVAAVLKAEADSLTAGKGRDTTAAVETAYDKWFGLPPKQGKGFLNRLTGNVADTRDKALAQEMYLFAARYRLLNRMFNQWMNYRCINGPDNFNGCKIDDCKTDSGDPVFAWSCAGTGAVFLCPSFWNATSLDAVQFKDQQASVLIHEGGHINWEAVGDTDLRGSGRNFRVADCYSTFVADIMGFPALANTCNGPTDPELH